MMIVLTKSEVKLLAKFFTEEFSNDPMAVSEWLDSQSLFESEEDRDSFITDVRAVSEQ